MKTALSSSLTVVWGWSPHSSRPASCAPSSPLQPALVPLPIPEPRHQDDVVLGDHGPAITASTAPPSSPCQPQWLQSQNVITLNALSLLAGAPSDYDSPTAAERGRRSGWAAQAKTQLMTASTSLTVLADLSTATSTIRAVSSYIDPGLNDSWDG